MRWLLLFVLLSASIPCPAQISRTPLQVEPLQLERTDLSDVLGLLCPGQEYIGQDSGCHTCPPRFKTAPGRVDASIASAIRGHFLKLDSDDLLLSLVDCGSVLLTRSASGWYVSQTDALPSGQCRKVSGRDGRDGLVCFAVTSSRDSQLAQLSFGYIAGDNADLLQAFDNTASACDQPKRVVIQSAILDVKFVPGSGKKLTLRITATCRKGLLNANSLKACKSGTGFEDIGPAAPFRNFRIDYNFDGTTLSLASASRIAKLAYDACAEQTQ